MCQRLAGTSEVADAVLEFYADQTDRVILWTALLWYSLHGPIGVIDKSHEAIVRGVRMLPKNRILAEANATRRHYRLTETGRDFSTGGLDADHRALEDEWKCQ